MGCQQEQGVLWTGIERAAAHVTTTGTCTVDLLYAYAYNVTYKYARMRYRAAYA